MTTLQILSRTKPFDALSRAVLGRLAVKSKMVAFRKGDILLQEGEPAEAAWLLMEGRIHIHRGLTGGGSVAVETLGRGDLFGTVCRVSGDWGTYPCTAVAAAKGAALKIPDGLFRPLLAEAGGFAQEMCILCAGRAKTLQKRAVLAHEPVSQRLAAALRDLVKTHGRDVPFTKRELADLVGAGLNTTFRAFTLLEKKGIVSSRYGGFRVLKPKQLGG